MFKLFTRQLSSSLTYRTIQDTVLNLISFCTVQYSRSHSLDKKNMWNRFRSNFQMTSFTFGSGGGVLSLLHPGSPVFPPPSIEMENALRRAVMTAAFTGAGAVPVWNLFWMFCKSDIVLITVVFMCSNSKTMLRFKSSSSSSSLFRRTTGLSQICFGDLLITLACVGFTCGFTLYDCMNLCVAPLKPLLIFLIFFALLTYNFFLLKNVRWTCLKTHTSPGMNISCLISLSSCHTSCGLSGSRPLKLFYEQCSKRVTFHLPSHIGEVALRERKESVGTAHNLCRKKFEPKRERERETTLFFSTLSFFCRFFANAKRKVFSSSLPPSLHPIFHLGKRGRRRRRM